jgi:hypothetical protein
MVMQWTVNPPTLSRLVRSQYSPPIRSYSLSVRIPPCHGGGTSSILVGTAKFCTVRLSVRTPAFHAGKRSSILLRCTIQCRINSVVECLVANENVIGSNPISCSKNNRGLEKWYLGSLISSSWRFNSVTRNQTTVRWQSGPMQGTANP